MSPYSDEFWQLLLAAEAPPKKSRQLIEDPGSSLFGPEHALQNSPTLNPSEKKRMALADPKALGQAIRDGTRILTEEVYPQQLTDAADFVSPALFVKGDSDCLFQPTVGIVGTRHATAYGKACAQKFAEALASQGVTVVSGGALGIDAAAHRGALAVGGATVAVLAGGIDTVYPAVHGTLFKEIQRKGCLVSQFCAGSRPLDYKFLARNVTIAALSKVLIVIQAPVRSGALSTAHASVEMGREVFVVPANIDSVEFTGSFNLLRDGATLCYHPDQVLEALSLGSAPQAAEPELSPASRKIMDVLTMTPLDSEKIAEKTGLVSSEVLSELTMLELDGWVQREPGGYRLRI